MTLATFLISRFLGRKRSEENPGRTVWESLVTDCLIRETKSTTSELARRATENLKIHAARAHYEAINVNCDDVTSWSEVVASLK